MVKCAACNLEFETDKQLHGHLKVHGMRIAEYYQKHFPRYDLHSREIIKFSDKEKYFAKDFNSRTNLRLWLKNQTPEKAKEYCINFLKKRKEQKGLVYAPAQVELRSTLSPPIQFYEDLFGVGGYYQLCAQLGLKNKYDIFSEVTPDPEYDKPEYNIVVDTREQKPLKFTRNIEVKTLKFGDYAFSNSSGTKNCYIERKSLPDLIGTLSGGYERFQEEIRRARDASAELIILVEDTLTNSLSFNYLPHISKKIRVNPDYVFHRVRSLTQEHPHIQFLFVGGRREASRVVEKIFTSSNAYGKMDLQLAYDLKIL